MQVYFFGNSDSPLLGIYHPPVSGYGQQAVLLCYPTFNEYMRTHWAFRRLAGLLSEADCHVFRFDYFGTGDSTGHGSEASVERWKADVVSAFMELKDVSVVRKISVVGARFGAALATLASTDDLEIDKLVLWDPVVSGKNYLDELIALNNSRSHIFPKISDNRAVSELMGYPFSEVLGLQIEQTDLLSMAGQRAERIFLISSEDKEEYRQMGHEFTYKPISFEHHKLNETCSWQSPEGFDQALIVNQVLVKIRDVIAGHNQ